MKLIDKARHLTKHAAKRNLLKEYKTILQYIFKQAKEGKSSACISPHTPLVIQEKLRSKGFTLTAGSFGSGVLHVIWEKKK